MLEKGVQRGLLWYQFSKFVTTPVHYSYLLCWTCEWQSESREALHSQRKNAILYVLWLPYLVPCSAVSPCYSSPLFCVIIISNRLKWHVFLEKALFLFLSSLIIPWFSFCSKFMKAHKYLFIKDVGAVFFFFHFYQTSEHVYEYII